MIGFIAKFVLGKFSGPVLIWILIALIGANVTQGWLLKRAWTKNAQAVLQCENAALRDAQKANDEVTAELVRIQNDLIDAKKENKLAAEKADRISAARLREKEIAQAQAVTDMEKAINAITDDEYFCASEPVPLPVLTGMRDAAIAYNKTKNNPSAGIPPD